MCDLFGGVLLLSLTFAQSLGCVHLAQYEARGTQASPVILRVYTDDGRLVSQWNGAIFSLSHWLVAPEVLVFRSGDATSALVAGDPESGRIYLIDRLREESVRYSNSPRAVIASSGRSQRQIPLPGEFARPSTDSSRDEVGQFAVKDGGVWYEDRLLVRNHGMTTSLHKSPSGRWVLIRQSQPAHSYMVFSISTDGEDHVTPRRAVPFEQLPLPRPQPAAQSPDGAWSVRYGSWVDRFVINGIGVFGRDGRRSAWNAAPIEGPWWSPTSDRFVYVDWNHLILSDLDGNTRQLVRAPFALLGWDDSRVLWLARGPSDH